jgi:hypothetical protein
MDETQHSQVESLLVYNRYEVRLEQNEALTCAFQHEILVDVRECCTPNAFVT